MLNSRKICVHIQAPYNALQNAHEAEHRGKPAQSPIFLSRPALLYLKTQMKGKTFGFDFMVTEI